RLWQTRQPPPLYTDDGNDRSQKRGHYRPHATDCRERGRAKTLLGQERNIEARQNNQCHQHVDADHHKERQRCQGDSRRLAARAAAMYFPGIELARSGSALAHCFIYRISQSATVSDRLIVRVCVTDPRHALFGQRFDLSPSSEPRPGWVSVLLADGRRRGLPRAATDLDLACETMPNHALPRVSVRTLLPLARYVEALLCNSSQTADGAPPSDDRADFGSGSWGPAAGTGAEAVAEDDGGATTRSGTADRPLAAIEA